MKKPQQSITTLPPSPEAERRSRMIKYSVMMGIRVACIVALLFAQGWWIAVFAVGAVVLPYFAVIIANVTTVRRGDEVMRPGGVVPVAPPAQSTPPDASEPPTASEDPRFRASGAEPRPEARPEGDAA